MSESPVSLNGLLEHPWPERNDFGRGYNHAIELLKDVLQQQREIRVVPDATEAMCDQARGFIMGLDLGLRSWKAMKKHLVLGGYPLPVRLLEMFEKDPSGHITKWDVADCIWQLMASECPKQEAQPAGEISEDIHDELFRAIKRALDSVPAEHTNLSKTGVLMNAIRPFLRSPEREFV